MSEQIKDNEFNAELKRKNSMDNSNNADIKPRSTSFKDSDKFIRTKSGTFVRQDSDTFEHGHSPSGSRTNSTGMPDFRQSIKAHLQKTKDAMPQVCKKMYTINRKRNPNRSSEISLKACEL